MKTTVASSAMTLERGDRRRWLWLAVFAAAWLALAAAAAFFAAARSGLIQARAEAAAAARSLADMRGRHQDARRRVALAAAGATLVADAMAAGFSPADWAERLVNVRQQRLTREAVDEMLRSTARGADGLFGADSFDVSVTHADEGLFTVPAGDGQPLQLTLRGTQMFRTREGVQ